MNRERFRFFSSVHCESDLLIGIPHAFFNPDMQRASLTEQTRLRRLILDFAATCPEFVSALTPVSSSGTNLHTTGTEPGSHPSDPDPALAPEELQTMMVCAGKTSTGPMSCVAGLFAEYVAGRIDREFTPPEIVVENGGDLYIRNRRELVSAIHAGSSPLSGKLGFAIPPGRWGVCTSSGTHGPSLSLGRADAVTVICRSAPLADAWATAIGNRVRTAEDMEPALNGTAGNRDILGCAVIVGDRIGIRGEICVKPLY